MTQALIWENGRFCEDSWLNLEAEENLDTLQDVKGNIILSWRQFNRIDYKSHKGKLGLCVHVGDDLEEISKSLAKFDVIVVNFPAFADGRAFSIARLIRDKYGFKGDIRANGVYILDQMPMLQRCGVTSFIISSDAVKAGLERGLWPDIPYYYQKALDGEGNRARTREVAGKRPWLSLNTVLDNDKAHQSAA